MHQMIKNKDKFFLDEAFHLDSNKGFFDFVISSSDIGIGNGFINYSKPVIGDNNWGFVIEGGIFYSKKININCFIACSDLEYKIRQAFFVFLKLCDECAYKGDTDYKMNFYIKHFLERIKTEIQIKRIIDYKVIDPKPFTCFSYRLEFNENDFNSLEISILGKKVCENLIYTIQKIQNIISDIEITGNDTESIRCEVLDHHLKMSRYEIDIVHNFIDFMYYLWKNTLPYKKEINEKEQ